MEMKVGPVVEIAMIRKYQQRLDKALNEHAKLKTGTETLTRVVGFVDCIERDIEACSSSKDIR